jgi:hypothetical protein
LQSLAGRPNAEFSTQRKVREAMRCIAQGKGFLFFLQIHITGGLRDSYEP